MIIRRSILISLLFVSSFCFASNSDVLTVEWASTSAEREWGLMGRTSMAENHGMFFIYPRAERMNFWMFNTFIDLSIAFIDKNRVVCEIYDMKAYPEKMDPNRPVKKLSDIDQYSYYGEEMQFFRDHSIHSKGKYNWALEVNMGWFERHDVRVGDLMEIDYDNHQIQFTHRN